MTTQFDAHYWESRYQSRQTAWDIGYPSPPLRTYIDGLTNTELRILIPGGGNGYEAEYLHQKGFSQVYVLDVAETPLRNLQERCADFPADHLWQRDFFAIHETFDLILEQTFFCTLPPAQRRAYAHLSAQFLRPKGKLVGVLFDCAFPPGGPPFGGNREEYRTYFEGEFTFRHFDTCYNSIPPRDGRELFICLEKKTFADGSVSPNGKTE